LRLTNAQGSSGQGVNTESRPIERNRLMFVSVLDTLELTYIERIFIYRTRSGRRETPTAMAKTAIAPRTTYSPRIEPPCIRLMFVDPAFLNVHLNCSY
jgi:hypothetical protein